MSDFSVAFGREVDLSGKSDEEVLAGLAWLPSAPDELRRCAESGRIDKFWRAWSKRIAERVDRRQQRKRVASRSGLWPWCDSREHPARTNWTLIEKADWAKLSRWAIQRLAAPLLAVLRSTQISSGGKVLIVRGFQHAGQDQTIIGRLSPTSTTCTDMFCPTDVTGNTPVDDDCHCHEGLIAQNLCPMSHESVAVSGWKGRHFIRLWLPLMFEEYWKVTLRHGAKMNFARLRGVDALCHLFTRRDIAIER